MRLRFNFKNKFEYPTNKDNPIFFSSYYEEKVVGDFFVEDDVILAKKAKDSLGKVFHDLKRDVWHQEFDYKKGLIYAKILELLNMKELTNPIDNMKISFFTPYPLRASYYYLKGMRDIYFTDLSNASDNILKALKMFKKLGYIYECAECYMGLGLIYRICGAGDINYTMLNEALKIFEKIEVYAKVAEVKAYLGIYELQAGNINNAMEYFDEALGICKKYDFKRTASDIFNWKGVGCFQYDNFDDAEKFFLKSLACPVIKRDGKVFSYEMLARIYYKTERYDLSLKYVDMGLKIHQKNKNKQGCSELMYLKAEVFWAKGLEDKCKEILINLIKDKHSTSLLYYPSNAYTLLGLICLKNNDFEKAKNLFMQASDLENAKDRIKGMVIDYNNLAEVSSRLGDKEEARRYLDIALDKALEIGDEDLIFYLKNKLNS